MRISSAVLASVFDVTELDNRPGFVVFQVSGKKALETFRHEAGGHRIQHVPKHDKKGRVHTSTVTVCLMETYKEAQIQIDPKDLEIKTCRGSGCGGQNRNKRDTAVQVTHLPTGLQVRCEEERSQLQNKERALVWLQERLLEAQQTTEDADRAADRKNQVGTGERSDKIRTYRFQDNTVIHKDGKKSRLDKFLKGFDD